MNNQRRILKCYSKRKWWTLGELSNETGNPTQTISASIRALRKHGWCVEKVWNKSERNWKYSVHKWEKRK